MDAEAFMAASLAAQPEICPKCGMRVVVPGTRAARAHGVCPVCYARALRDLAQTEAEEAGALREYDRARQDRSRAARRRKRRADAAGGFSLSPP